MFRKHLQQLLLVVVIAVLTFGAAPPVVAGDDQRFVVFGDSLSDSGNAFVLLMDVELPPFELIPDAPYARGGLHFSNGKTWVEQLAADLDAQRSTRPALLQPLRFSNYAVGGARARPEGIFDLASQVQLFLRDFGGSAPSDALYVVYLGSNDARDALAALVTDPSGATSAMILQAALGAIRDNLLMLHAAGARRFLVPNVPNLALVPAVRLQGPAAQAAAQWLATSFNDGLATLLNGLEAGLGMDIARLDVFALLNEVVATPAAFGLTEVEAACITPNTRIHPYCTRPDNYLFWDGIHPTRAGHGILATRAGVALGVSPKSAVYALH